VASARPSPEAAYLRSALADEVREEGKVELAALKQPDDACPLFEIGNTDNDS